MCLYPQYVKFYNGKPHFSSVPLPDYIPIACGSCIECCIHYSNEWTARCYHEFLKTEKGFVLTLTYNSEHLPKDGQLHREDVQLFFKRLRKKYTFRYFGCGEYGGKTLRPHFHIIFFGFEPDDIFYWCKSKSHNDLYRSFTIEKFWNLGYSYIEKFDLKAVKYCCKYLQKCLFAVDSRTRNFTKPFIMMSRHPGIGNPTERCLQTDKLYYGGNYVSTPRFYLKKLESRGVDLEPLKAKRRLHMTNYCRSEKKLKILKKSLDSRYGLC